MTDDHLKKVSLNSQSDDVKARRAKLERDIAEFQQRGGQRWSRCRNCAGT
jgi:hypothetical protein